MFAFARPFHSPLFLLSNGEGGGGGSGEGAGGGQGAGEGAGGGQGQGAGEGAGNGGQGAGAGGGGDETVTLTKAELAAKDSAIAAANRRAKELEDAEEKRKADEAKEQGKYKDLAESEQKKREDLEAGLKEGAIETAVVSLAGDLKFASPSLAAKVIDLADIEAEIDGNRAKVDDGNKAKIKAALEKAAKDHPELLGAGSKPPRKQRQQKDGEDESLGDAKADFNADIRRRAGAGS